MGISTLLQSATTGMGIIFIVISPNGSNKRKSDNIIYKIIQKKIN